LAVLSQFFQLSPIMAQENGCKDSLTVRLEGEPHSQTHLQAWAKAREFIWSHWRQRTCADLLLTAWSREGVRTDSHYKIELVGQNVTVLSVTLARADDPSAPVYGLAVPASGRIPAVLPENRSYQAFVIERVKVRVPYFVEKAKVIPDDKVVPSSEYRLRFRDKDGQVITDF
jgi:hypothetical protein